MADKTELAFLSGVLFFLTAILFINALLPTTLQFISTFSIATFAAATTITAGVCVITSGIPCAFALGLSAFANSFPSLLDILGISIPAIENITLSSPYSWIGTLILVPITYILTIYIASLARG